jgi:hypothetical protein
MPKGSGHVAVVGTAFVLGTVVSLANSWVLVSRLAAIGAAVEARSGSIGAGPTDGGTGQTGCSKMSGARRPLSNRSIPGGLVLDHHVGGPPRG